MISTGGEAELALRPLPPERGRANLVAVDHRPLGISPDGWPPPSMPAGPQAESWFTLAHATHLIARGDLRPEHVVLYVDEPSAAATAFTQLDAAGFTGSLSVLLPRTGVDRYVRTLQQLQTAIDNIPAPIFSKDSGGVYGACNKAFEEYVGISRDKIIGRTVHEIWPPSLAGVYAAADQALIAAGGSQIYEARVRYADGSLHDVTFYKGAFTDDQGGVQGLAGAILDITERRLLETKLRELAERDPLTGAANRALFTRRLEEASGRAAEEKPPAVLLIDLDDFKIVNDTLGHDAGDRLLIAVTDLLRHNVRTEDTVARLGGDEFAVLLENVPEPALDPLVERILAAFVQPVSAGGWPLTVRASIGVAHGRRGDSGADLLRGADIALYLAKEQGKGQCARFRPGMKVAILEQAELLDGLGQALARNGEQLHVAYQPIFKIDDGSVTGVEALARWRRSDGGSAPAGVFVPVAERSGLIIPLGQWVRERAYREADGWRSLGEDIGRPDIHVNVSVQELRQPGFLDEAQRMLTTVGLEPNRLVIEIVEAALSGDAVIARNLHGIRDLGVRIALDEFGAGPGSLAVLADAPVDVVKVGKSLLDQVTESDRHARVAGAVPGLAESLGIEVIAKGVETASQARLLHELGYRFAQGFYYARPLSAEDVRLVLAAGHGGSTTGRPY